MKVLVKLWCHYYELWITPNYKWKNCEYQNCDTCYNACQKKYDEE